MGAGPVSDSSTGFRDPTPHTGSPGPAIKHGKVLSLTIICYTMLY